MEPAHPLFQDGAEIVVKYSSPPGLIPIRIYLKGWIATLPVYDRMHPVGASGALEVRLVCAPNNLKVYVGDNLEHEVDPGQITYSDEVNPHYWVDLHAALPYNPSEPGPGWREVSDQWNSWRVYPSTALPHIREVAYYGLSARPQEPFFTAFVRAYEIAGEGSGAVSPPPPPPPPTDDLSGDTVVTIDVPSASPIPIESLPFRAIFSYALGAPEEAPPTFVVILDAGTYKFSTALSPGREEHDTQIALISIAEGTVYVNDDISDGSPYDRRSEITMALPAGGYAVAVGTSGMIFGADGSLNSSGATQIPPGAVLRISKV